MSVSTSNSKWRNAGAFVTLTVVIIAKYVKKCRDVKIFKSIFKNVLTNMGGIDIIKSTKEKRERNNKKDVEVQKNL